MLGPETLASDDTVLIVDDELFSRRTLSQTLKNVGAPQFMLAKDVSEAEEALRQSGVPPRLVILDFDMPERTGLALLKDIRCGKLPVPRDLPILMLSGCEDEAVIHAALALDVDAFVAKPLWAEGLRVRLPFLLQSDPHIKDVEIYQSMPVENLKADVTRHDPTPPPGARIVTVAELETFLTLATDVRSSRGGLVVAKGTIISTRLMSLLRDLQEGGLQLAPIWVEDHSHAI